MSKKKKNNIQLGSSELSVDASSVVSPQMIRNNAKDIAQVSNELTSQGISVAASVLAASASPTALPDLEHQANLSNDFVPANTALISMNDVFASQLREKISTDHLPPSDSGNPVYEISGDTAFHHVEVGPDVEYCTVKNSDKLEVKSLGVELSGITLTESGEMVTNEKVIDSVAESIAQDVRFSLMSILEQSLISERDTANRDNYGVLSRSFTNLSRAVAVTLHSVQTVGVTGRIGDHMFAKIRSSNVLDKRLPVGLDLSSTRNAISRIFSNHSQSLTDQAKSKVTLQFAERLLKLILSDASARASVLSNVDTSGVISFYKSLIFNIDYLAGGLPKKLRGDKLISDINLLFTETPSSIQDDLIMLVDSYLAEYKNCNSHLASELLSILDACLIPAVFTAFINKGQVRFMSTTDMNTSRLVEAVSVTPLSLLVKSATSDLTSRIKSTLLKSIASISAVNFLGGSSVASADMSKFNSIDEFVRCLDVIVPRICNDINETFTAIRTSLIRLACCAESSLEQINGTLSTVSSLGNKATIPASIASNFEMVDSIVKFVCYRTNQEEAEVIANITDLLRLPVDTAMVSGDYRSMMAIHDYSPSEIDGAINELTNKLLIDVPLFPVVRPLGDQVTKSGTFFKTYPIIMRDGSTVQNVIFVDDSVNSDEVPTVYSSASPVASTELLGGKLGRFLSINQDTFGPSSLVDKSLGRLTSAVARVRNVYVDNVAYVNEKYLSSNFVNYGLIAIISTDATITDMRTSLCAYLSDKIKVKLGRVSGRLTRLYQVFPSTKLLNSPQFREYGGNVVGRDFGLTRSDFTWIYTDCKLATALACFDLDMSSDNSHTVLTSVDGNVAELDAYCISNNIVTLADEEGEYVSTQKVMLLPDSLNRMSAVVDSECADLRSTFRINLKFNDEDNDLYLINKRLDKLFDILSHSGIDSEALLVGRDPRFNALTKNVSLCFRALNNYLDNMAVVKSLSSQLLNEDLSAISVRSALLDYVEVVDNTIFRGYREFASTILNYRIDALIYELRAKISSLKSLKSELYIREQFNSETRSRSRVSDINDKIYYLESFLDLVFKNQQLRKVATDYLALKAFITDLTLVPEINEFSDYVKVIRRMANAINSDFVRLVKWSRDTNE